VNRNERLFLTVPRIRARSVMAFEAKASLLDHFSARETVIGGTVLWAVASLMAGKARVRLCHKAGGELDQALLSIDMSIQISSTTDRIAPG
jgi:hypothetical protein